MSDEEIKRLILARRAAFVAAAVATLAATECAPKEADPGPCLSAPYNPNGERPQVCLSVPPTLPDASPETDAGTAVEYDAPPAPCLSPMVAPPDASPAPPPQVCLTPPRKP